MSIAVEDTNPMREQDPPANAQDSNYFTPFVQIAGKRPLSVVNVLQTAYELGNQPLVQIRDSSSPAASQRESGGSLGMTMKINVLKDNV
jgi:hypothetical protein